ncbi:hypothetical protein Bhyg_10268 [Pseudolycoriella hygida]|uniref:Plethodontid modulating factor n=1 Tax=Pseudolycoriella hygida TaxID=35572 RepID=A0A9Q0MT77_9DIPT|nr:hypothetical protein Bhyg_10268 [Pseudolycoriella hygida]
MSIRKLLLILIISIVLNAVKAGWCYYGGCHSTTAMKQACPSMADNVGRDNMRILSHKKFDKWHEKLWGRKYFCCTNDCQHQKCGILE